MKAILIVFDENVEIQSRLQAWPNSTINEHQCITTVERYLRSATHTEKGIEITVLNEEEYREIRIAQHAQTLKKHKNVTSARYKQPLPIFVETIRFLDELKDMYHGTDLGFIIHAVVIDKKKRPCIAAGIDLCKRFTKLINIERNKKAFGAYMNHLDNEELDNLIHFIKLISKI